MKAEVYIDASSLLKQKSVVKNVRFPISYSLIAGNGFSGMKGSGCDLYGIREFQPGDDMKQINYQATARTGKVHLNEYLEERMLSAYFLLDQSTHMFFTSKSSMKSVIAAKKTAELLFYYQQHGHLVSGEVYNNVDFAEFPTTNSYASCEKWLTEVASFNKELLSLSHRGSKKCLADALRRCIDRNLRDRELYVLSDFMVSDWEVCLGLIATLNVQNRIYMIQISDRMEDAPPQNIWLQGELGSVKFRKKSEVEYYRAKRKIQKKAILDFARHNAISYIELFT